MSLSCSIYRSSKRQGMYLYLPSGAAQDELPAALLQYVGRLEHAMDLELSAERKLAQVRVTMRLPPWAMSIRRSVVPIGSDGVMPQRGDPMIASAGSSSVMEA